MTHNTVLNLEHMHPFEPPNSRGKRLGVHQENLFTTSWNVVSATYKEDTSIGNHSWTCEKGMCYTTTKSAVMKEIGASANMNM